MASCVRHGSMGCVPALFLCPSLPFAVLPSCSVDVARTVHAGRRGTCMCTSQPEHVDSVASLPQQQASLTMNPARTRPPSSATTTPIYSHAPTPQTPNPVRGSASPPSVRKTAAVLEPGPTIAQVWSTAQPSIKKELAWKCLADVAFKRPESHPGSGVRRGAAPATANLPQQPRQTPASQEDGPSTSRETHGSRSSSNVRSKVAANVATDPTLVAATPADTLATVEVVLAATTHPFSRGTGAQLPMLLNGGANTPVNTALSELTTYTKQLAAALALHTKGKTQPCPSPGPTPTTAANEAPGLSRVFSARRASAQLKDLLFARRGGKTKTKEKEKRTASAHAPVAKEPVEAATTRRDPTINEKEPTKNEPTNPNNTQTTGTTATAPATESVVNVGVAVNGPVIAPVALAAKPQQASAPVAPKSQPATPISQSDAPVAAPHATSAHVAASPAKPHFTNPTARKAALAGGKGTVATPLPTVHEDAPMVLPLEPPPSPPARRCNILKAKPISPSRIPKVCCVPGTTWVFVNSSLWLQGFLTKAVQPSSNWFKLVRVGAPGVPTNNLCLHWWPFCGGVPRLVRRDTVRRCRPRLTPLPVSGRRSMPMSGPTASLWNPMQRCGACASQ